MRLMRVLIALTPIILAQPVSAQSDPEALRVALRSILETQQETALMIGSTDAQETVAEALEQLDQLTWEELVILEGSEGRISDLQAKQDALYAQLEVLEGYMPNLGEVVQQSLQYSSVLPQRPLTGNAYIGLTNANYGAICGSNIFGDPPLTPNRANPDANQALVAGIVASDIALAATEGVRDVADLVCEGVLVIAGFGGNPQSVACIVTNLLYLGATTLNTGLKTAFRLLTFCDGTIDGAEIEGAFERTADIYDQNVDIDSDLAAHDADIKALLATMQSDIDQNQQLLNEVIELLLTPEGIREGFPQVE
jgi:hypothetical protein